jgi:Cd2+/Zn2+-exporting ATPase
MSERSSTTRTLSEKSFHPLPLATPAPRPSSFPRLKAFIPALVGALMLSAGLAADHLFSSAFFQGPARLIWYVLAYLPVGAPIVIKAWRHLRGGEVFTEFFLMSLATLGAFAIGEYAEAAAVMLFYTIGELFQATAVHRARGDIQALLDARPQIAWALREGRYVAERPEAVGIGETIQVKGGERAPLDGVLLSEAGSFDPSALTGESRPRVLRQEEQVLAGMINTGQVVELRVNLAYEDSALSRVLYLAQHAAQRKAPTERFIRRFARVYTPAVVALAAALAFLPALFVSPYIFADWLYRALVFLVISCPCALVISIPLSYFGGIGAASRQGLLFKGANYLDLAARVNVVAFDKTGTLTEGVFEVRRVETTPGVAEEELLERLAAVESQSSHPIAKAILRYAGERPRPHARRVEEFPGQGIRGEVDGAVVLAGNATLLARFGLTAPPAAPQPGDTLVLTAIDGRYAGCLYIADRPRPGAEAALKALRAQGVERFVLLSGDAPDVAEDLARKLGMDEAHGGLLPQDKADIVRRLREQPGATVAFAGEGINDAPALAASDLGIAMGGLGSDLAIETADLVIQTDQLEKIATAMRIGKATRRIVWQNIALAFGVKLLVLALGAFGLAAMWEAVFADVGVALLAILNAVRIQR